MKKNLNKSFELVNTIQKTLRFKQLVHPAEPVLLSISGGQDSICLLMIFYLLKAQWNLEYGIIWCHHLWQKDSFYVMLHLARLGFCFQFPTFFSITSKKVLTEKNARDWRHQTTQRICFFYNYNFCTQGHTGSDRVETVLFNLMRGSGTTGICALHWSKTRVAFSLNKFHFSEFQQFKKPVANTGFILTQRVNHGLFTIKLWKSRRLYPVKSLSPYTKEEEGQILFTFHINPVQAPTHSCTLHMDRDTAAHNKRHLTYKLRLLEKNLFFYLQTKAPGEKRKSFHQGTHFFMTLKSHIFFPSMPSIGSNEKLIKKNKYYYQLKTILKATK